MTSRKSFWKQCKIDIKKQMPMFGISLASYMLMLVFAVGVYISNSKVQMLNYVDEITYRQMKAQALMTMLSGTRGIILLTAVVLGFASALQAYAWINKANQVDFYYAQPVKRSHRFWSLNVSNVLLFLGGLIVAEVIANIIIAIGGFWTVNMIVSSLFGIGLSVLCYLSGFAITLIAVLLTGNSFLAFLGGGFLIMLDFLAQWIYIMYVNVFSVSRYTYYQTGNGLHFCFGPITAVAQIIVGAQTIRPNAWVLESLGGANADILLKTVLMLLVQCFVYFAIAYLLFKKRPAISGEKQMIFPITKPFIKSIILIIGSLWFGLLYTLTMELMGNDEKLGLWGVIIGLLIIQVVVQSLMDGHIRSFAKGWLSFLISAVISVGLFCGFAYGWFGYDSYLPKEEDIAYFSVDIWNNSSWGTQLKEDGNLYVGHVEQIETRQFKDKESVEALLNTLDEVMKEADGKLSATRYSSDTNGVTLHVKYALKDGKVKYRTYQLSCEDVYELEKTLNKDQAYRESKNPVSAKGAQKILDEGGTITAYYTNSNLSAQDYQTRKKDEVMQIISLTEQAYLNRDGDIEMTDAPIGCVELQITKSDRNYDIVQVPAYACDKELISYLEEKGWMESTSPSMDAVREVEVTRHYEYEEGSYSSSKNWTADEEIAKEIVENCCVCRDTENRLYAFGYADLNYDVVIYTKDGAAYPAYIYKGKVPKNFDANFETEEELAVQ